MLNIVPYMGLLTLLWLLRHLLFVNWLKLTIGRLLLQYSLSCKNQHRARGSKALKITGSTVTSQEGKDFISPFSSKADGLAGRTMDL